MGHITTEAISTVQLSRPASILNLSTGVILAAAMLCPPVGAADRGTSACTGPIAQCKDQALQLSKPSDKGAHGIAGAVGANPRNTFQTTLSGRTYYLTTNVYRRDTSAASPSKGQTDQSLCGFYLFDAEKHRVADIAASVGVRQIDQEPAGRTECKSIAGMSGAAFHGAPAVLAIMKYSYQKTRHSAASGPMTTAILLPLTRGASGGWQFSQDTSCLPAGNSIIDLASAKEQLAVCGAAPLDSQARRLLATDWCQPKTGNTFQEFKLDPKGRFASWRHMRPEFDGKWALADRHLRIAAQLGTTFDLYVKSVSQKTLLVMEDGDAQTYVAGPTSQCVSDDPYDQDDN